MRPSVALTIAAAVAGVFGVLMLAVPAAVLEGFGAPPHADGIVVARDVGGLYLGLCAIFWSARSWPAGAALRSVLFLGVLTQVLSTLTNAWAAATGLIGPAAWPGVAVHVAVAAVLASALPAARATDPSADPAAGKPA